MIQLLAFGVLTVLAWSARPRPRRPPVDAPHTRHRLPTRSTTRRRAAEAALPHSIELVVLAVRAGMLPSAAVAAVVPHVPEPVKSAFAEVARRVVDGARFADAIEWLPRDLGPAALPLADSLAAADRDGLPLAPVLDRLAADARHQRRRRTEAAARQLPVRLSLPLVLCTLPSFVLLAVVPLLLAALASLHR